MTNYQNGAARERRIVNMLKRNGWDIANRSAGSHSPVDIFAISRKRKMILFVQSKPRSMSDNAKKKIEDELDWLNDEYIVRFKVC